MKKLLTFGVILASFLSAFSSPRADSVAIRFNLSRTDINPDLHHNRQRLEYVVNALMADSTGPNRPAVSFTGGASPEGPFRLNESLSTGRAHALSDYLASRNLGSFGNDTFTYLGPDWNGLLERVKNNTDVPSKSELVSIINEAIGNPEQSPEYISQIHRLSNGRTYAYILKNIFPSLRESHIIFKYPSVADRFGKVTDSLYTPLVTPSLNLSPLPNFAEPDICRPRYFALKTNLLYDALILPSIGAEYYLGKNWSITAQWTYGWWDRDKTHFYWRAYGGDLGVRRWFGKKAEEKPLTGHHLGVYGGAVTYDFEFGGTGYMGGLPGKPLWSRCNFMAGVEYGYSLPIARRLNLDFVIGLGWLGGKVIEYKPVNDVYIWEKTHRLNWFGPTKAEVSLVWLIGCGNYNKTKGGLK